MDGKLNKVKFRKDPIFGFEVPTECAGVPTDILDPAIRGADRDEYFRKYDALAARFIENFKLFADGCPKEVIAAGPKRLK